MDIFEAQQFCIDKFGSEPTTLYPLKLIYKHGIINVGDYNGRLVPHSPFEKWYGTWEGHNIKSISGGCEENRLDHRADDMFHHFKDKSGNFITKPFLITDALIRFEGDWIRFNGFKITVLEITK